MGANLAIIIPAYKVDFFEKTLESISLQTNKNFVVYIGDDNSPNDLYSVIEKYESAFTIKYTKFKENIGSISLVKQWERCIALIQDEQWVWLFSDDDTMDKNCVDSFYKSLIDTKESYDLYRFNTNTINENDLVISENPQFKKIQSSFDFINSKLKGEIRSFVSEYIFSKSIYFKEKGFIEFPLAWASDDATWVKFGFEKGIYTIPVSRVAWRLSNINISNSSNSNGNMKCFALILYSKWLIEFLKEESEISILKSNLRKFFLFQFNHYKIKLSIKFLYKILTLSKKTLNISYIKFVIYILLKKVLQR